MQSQLTYRFHITNNKGGYLVEHWWNFDGTSRRKKGVKNNP